ncbi:sortilin isoform X2 [Pseudopipra pipra]|uniref:sortilin isoform X2 n=1 Tax=Pseudopipra pipra TaxID=415032 RepID=UPI0031399289
MSFGQSKLYRSEDYGKTFQDITGLINNTFIRTEFGMAIGPENSGKVILTGDVSGGGRGGRIFRSWDFARNFVPTELPFHPLAQISYSPRRAERLLALSTENGLWISTDFGEHWREIHKSVCLAKWGENDTIFFTTFLNNSCTDLGFLELKKTPDLGRSFRTIGSRIYSFGMGGRFLFASVMTEQGTTRRIHVSLDQGDSWNMAQLPSVGHEQFYSILAANDDLVFMHVDEPGDTGFGTIYTSDERGILYSKSLERHLYTTTGGETDFTNVTSLRGTFITSVLAEDNSIRSVITFDRGGQWEPLRRPHNSPCDGTAPSGDQCSLHIHALYSISQKLNVPMAPLSEPNAVGIVLAHGSVGGGHVRDEPRRVRVRRRRLQLGPDPAGSPPLRHPGLGGAARGHPAQPASPSTPSCSPRTRGSAGTATPSPPNRSSSRAWPRSRGLAPAPSACGGSGGPSPPGTGCPTPWILGSCSAGPARTRTTPSGWLTPATPALPVTAACWATRSSSGACARPRSAATGAASAPAPSAPCAPAPCRTSCGTDPKPSHPKPSQTILTQPPALRVPLHPAGLPVVLIPNHPSTQHSPQRSVCPCTLQDFLWY